MTPDHWLTLVAVFARAADLDPAARPLYLDAACRTPSGAPDAAFRREVERLLELDPDARDFFGTSPPPDAEA